MLYLLPFRFLDFVLLRTVIPRFDTAPHAIESPKMATSIRSHFTAKERISVVAFHETPTRKRDNLLFFPI